MEIIKPVKVKYVSYIMLQSVVYGVGNPLTKVAYESITPFWLLTFRFSIALLIFSLFFGKRIISQLRTAKFSKYFPASLCMALAYITCNLALNWTSATNVGFLMSLPVIFTPLLATVILNQKYDFRYLPLQIILIIGLYLLCSNEGGFTLNKGDIFALITAIALSGALVFGKKSLESLDAVTISATQAGVTALMSLICALVFDDFSIVPNIAPAAWGVIVYLAVTCTCIAYVLQNSALVHLSSNIVSMLQCTQPILTAVCSFIILRETMSFRGILGGLIIIGSILVANLLETKENELSHEICDEG
ncbi:DMT family transporter [Clostridium sp.]|uniref:DMT family transporter n=1 Tax=Clostridium sp. TaxID=1506 RepID=UPI002FCA4974